ncbi:MAG: hypothetical protein EAX90_14310 [Candidatus Heimdallarchaeota archaeon]|nr:hypothetical protein [Candidatus Heimdallarchaeota archaeon]
MNEINLLNEIVKQYSKTQILEKKNIRILISELGGRILAIDCGFGNILWNNPKLEENNIC